MRLEAGGEFKGGFGGILDLRHMGYVGYPLCPNNLERR